MTPVRDAPARILGSGTAFPKLTIGTKELLEKWGRLHSLRTIAGFLAFSIQIAAGSVR